MNALCISDHGSVASFYELHTAAKESGIKPIFGCEAYFTEDIDIRDGQRDYSHLLLLAKNKIGYENLIKLSSIANSSGFYYRPRIGKRELEQYGEGLIVTSACVGGVLCKPY